MLCKIAKKGAVARVYPGLILFSNIKSCLLNLKKHLQFIVLVVKYMRSVYR
jgi:hypothetical protein